MNFKQTKRQLRIWFYSEKRYSIFSVSQATRKFRIFSAAFFVLFSIILLIYGEPLYAAGSLTYAIGIIPLGFLRGFTLLLFPIIIKLYADELSVMQDGRVVTFLTIVSAAIIYEIYRRTIRDGFYTETIEFKRNENKIRYESVYEKLLPISDIYKCLVVDVKKHPEDELGVMSRRLLNGAINATKKLEMKYEFFCVGHINGFENGADSSVYYYSTRRGIGRIVSIIADVFEDSAKFDITTNVYEDPNWNVYKEKLKPTMYEEHELYNNIYIDYLEKKHFDFERMYNLYFRFKVKPNQEYSVFSEELKERGYKIMTEKKSDVMWEDGNVLFVASDYGKIGKYRVNMKSREIIELGMKYNIELYDWVIGEFYEKI